MAHEAVELLSRYIQIDTTNPPGNEEPAAEFFAEIFDREGVEYKTYESGPTRVSIRAVLRGSGEKKPVILLNHMDVVPAVAQDWSFDPFSGEVKDGYVHGRGALDMKGMGIMELLSFLAMKREGVELNRDLVFLAVPDEETGGDMGMGYLMENHPEDFEADLVLNEGGFGITDILPDKKIMLVAPAEKGICWLRLTRKGLPGHGSMPHDNNALARLNQALCRLLSEDSPVTITPVVADYFKELGEGWEFLKPYLDDGKTDTLVRVLEESGLLAIPQINAVVKNTISLTIMRSGEKTNVIPSTAVAELDARILPGQDLQEFIDQVKSGLVDEEISVECVKSSEPSESPIDEEYFPLIGDVFLEHFPDSLYAPILLAGISDSRFFREKGVITYGVGPVFVPLEDIKMVHGLDEKVSTDGLVKGTEVLTDIVRRLCTE